METDAGPELAGKDRLASEKEGTTGEAADIFEAERGVAEAAGIEKFDPGGRGGGKELMEDIGAASGSPTDGETDG